MNIISGKIHSAQKIVVYGPEGIGKSTFAAQFPDPVFIDTEGSTKHMDVKRFDKPTSWTMLLDQVKYVKANPQACKTLVIDTADWAETLCINHICSKSQKSGIEDFGYGKGYTYLEEEFGRLLNALEEVIEVGVNVVVTAHAQMRKFEQPDEMGAYDRWELKLEKKTAPLLKEWADMVLFANYKTLVVNVDNQGAQKGKNKAQGGQRVMYTTHHPCWDAKNRFGLKEELKFEFSEIARCIPELESKQPITNPVESAPTPSTSLPPLTTTQPVVSKEIDKIVDSESPAPAAENTVYVSDDIPKALRDLMVANSVIESEIQIAVSQKGYYPSNTPILNYGEDFINGVLVGAWEKVFAMIEENRKFEVPF